MAIKRKPTASPAKAAKTKKNPASAATKKSPVRAGAKKPTIARPAPGKAAAKPVKEVKSAKPVKEVKSAKPVKEIPAAKPVKGIPAARFQKPVPPAKAVKGRSGGKLRVVSTPAVVRPIGALPPEAVARAMRAVPPPAPRPGRVIATPARKPAPATTPDQGANGVTEEDYKEFEQRLLAERQKILKEMGHLESTVLKVNQRESAGDLSGYSFHMADVGTDAMEREKAFLFASNEGALLQEIDHALRKLYRGEFGPCENCGRPISRARLEAMPYARLCLTCKEEEERSNRGQQ